MEGLSGIFAKLDDALVEAYWRRPRTFTPAEFNQFWNRRTENQKIYYVLSLIT